MDTHARPVDPANISRRRDTRERTKRGAGHLASGRLRPEPQAVTDVAGDAFYHADLRVCRIDRSGVRSSWSYLRPIDIRSLCVRKSSRPSEIAGVARMLAPMSFIDTSS